MTVYYENNRTCECNECGWEGCSDELEWDSDGTEEFDICPCCGSEDIWFD